MKIFLCRIGCIYQCKDTNFKANHNAFARPYSQRNVVFTNAKILILKLITTLALFHVLLIQLYLPMQRY
ncbi:Uncharacterised protein [Prevotella intermedia]|nr:Uncharacterised protein [Prevotella intermedia]